MVAAAAPHLVAAVSRLDRARGAAQVEGCAARDATRGWLLPQALHRGRRGPALQAEQRAVVAKEARILVREPGTCLLLTCVEGIGRLPVEEAESAAGAQGVAPAAAGGERRERRTPQQRDGGQVVAQTYHLQMLVAADGHAPADLALAVAAIQQPARPRKATALAQQQVVDGHLHDVVRSRIGTGAGAGLEVDH